MYRQSGFITYLITSPRTLPPPIRMRRCQLNELKSTVFKTPKEKTETRYICGERKTGKREGRRCGKENDDNDDVC